MATNIKNHYAILGVRPEAGGREILKARNKLLHRWHPDINQEYPEEANEKTLDILLAAEILLNEFSRAEYDRIYRNHFQSVTKRKVDRSGVDASRAREAWQEQSIDFIVCPSCGRKNMRSKRNYCMFCGAGIGENAKPFSWKDVDVNSPAFKEQLRESILNGLISNGHIILLLAAAVCILADAIISDMKPGQILKIALLIACVLYVAIHFRE